MCWHGGSVIVHHNLVVVQRPPPRCSLDGQIVGGNVGGGGTAACSECARISTANIAIHAGIIGVSVLRGDAS